jgi:hypothetical protein
MVGFSCLFTARNGSSVRCISLSPLIVGTDLQMNGATMSPLCPARVARRLATAALLFAGLVTAPTASADPVDLPKVPLGALETVPYTPTDPMITEEQFQADIAKVKTVPFAWSWTDGRTSFAQPPADQESINAAIEKIETGRVDMNAAVGPGSSILGVPHAQTLVHSTIMASKTINGQLSQAVCQYEIFTATPNATRQIEIGAAWYCNQPWVRGAVSAAGAGLNNPDGSVALYPLPITQPLIYIDGSKVNETLYSKVTFNRGFEIQLEDIYGYISLNVDNPSSPNDNFFGQPSAEGAYASYNCAGASTQHVVCEFISDPFTFVPTDNTTCTSGDVCGQAGVTQAQIQDAIEQGQIFAQDPAIPAEPSATSPAGDGQAIDESTAEDPYGDWVALPSELASQVQSGQISLLAAETEARAAGAVPFHCSARFTKKVGDIFVHTETGSERHHEVRWTVRNRCEGGNQAVYFTGDHQLVRDVSPKISLSQLYGYEYAATGFVMSGHWNGKAIEINKRRPKRVWWDMNIEAPPGYNWVTSTNVGDLRGIDERKMDCHLESTGGFPAYANKLSCFMASDRFT